MIINCEPVKDLARAFKVSQPCISGILSEIRKNPEALRERIQQESEQALADEKLANFIEEKLSQREVIERADDVRKEYEECAGIKVKVWRVRHVMRDLLNLRYNKIVKLPVHGNSERCLV